MSDQPTIPERLAPSEIQAWVKNALASYAVLSGIDSDAHWSSQFVAIMMRLDYMPRRELLADHNKLDHRTNVEMIGLVKITQRYISRELLDDLQAEIELAETDSRVEVMSMRDENGNRVEGSIFVSESGTLCYTDHAEQKLDTSKDRGNGWGSW